MYTNLYNNFPEKWMLVKNCFLTSQLATLYFSKWNHLCCTKLGLRQHPTEQIFWLFHTVNQSFFYKWRGKGDKRWHTSSFLAIPPFHSCPFSPNTQMLAAHLQKPPAFSLNLLEVFSSLWNPQPHAQVAALTTLATPKQGLARWKSWDKWPWKLCSTALPVAEQL